MKNFKLLAFTFLTVITLFSCSSNDDDILDLSKKYEIVIKQTGDINQLSHVLIITSLDSEIIDESGQVVSIPIKELNSSFRSFKTSSSTSQLTLSYTGGIDTSSSFNAKVIIEILQNNSIVAEKTLTFSDSTPDQSYSNTFK